MKKPLTKKQKLAAYIKQQSAFYTFEDFNQYTIKELEAIKRGLQHRQKRSSG